MREKYKVEFEIALDPADFDDAVVNIIARSLYEYFKFLDVPRDAIINLKVVKL